MGLFSFLQKKEAVNVDTGNRYSDLPEVSGSQLDDLSLPSLDIAPEQVAAPQVQPQISPPVLQQDNRPISQQDNHTTPIDLSKDINQLFLSDPAWKEPDWENYEPYYEDQIEPPALKDFGIGERAQEVTQSPKKYDVPEFTDVMKERTIPAEINYDVFVKGDDYAKVRTQMSDIKAMLLTQESKTNEVLETSKQEEEAIAQCKNNMELIYKRLLLVDKKVFT